MSRTIPHVVIAGGSGFLGLTWAAAIKDRYRITLIQHKRHVVVPFASVVRADLSEPHVVHKLLAELVPDILINAAGMTNVEACEAAPHVAELVNARLPQELAKFCASHHLKFIHISTDHLFDGTCQNQSETAVPSPLNVYAATKADGEARVRAENPDALVLRTNFFGWGPVHKPSFSDTVLSALRAGEAINLFEDAWYTPIYTEDLISLTHELISRDVSGVVNVVGPDRITKCDFGRRLARYFEFDEKLIIEASLADRDDLTNRPRDMSLDDGLLTSLLGHGAPPIERAFEQMRGVEETNLVRRF
jgi:dTDP-4-dehydrorhamnose reductase